VTSLTQIPWLVKLVQGFSRSQTICLPEEMSGHVVVAGYGRVGQVVVKILQSQRYAVLVIENSEASVQRLRIHKIAYIFGDADSQLVLQTPHIETARALAIALPDPASTRLLLKYALALAHL
jgi:CPA2 family monovalent cation:H+ antiporter-2